MAIWNGLSDWLGGTAVEASMRKAEEEASKREYINQLQNQWNSVSTITVTNPQNIQNMHTSPYGGMLTSVSTDNNVWAGLAQTQYTHTNIPVTTGGIGTGLGNVYGHPIYQQLPASVVASTGSYAVYPYPTPAVTPQNPQIGDKLVMEYDGKDWITRYEAANTPKIMPKPKGIEFSLDELEEASKIIEDLQHEAA